MLGTTVHSWSILLLCAVLGAYLVHAMLRPEEY